MAMTRPRTAGISIAAGAMIALGACAPEGFPDDALFGDAGDPPPQRLAPIDPALADPADDERTGAAREELLDRGADLRDRAEALRAREG